MKKDKIFDKVNSLLLNIVGKSIKQCVSNTFFPLLEKGQGASRIYFNSSDIGIESTSLLKISVSSL